MNDTSPVRYAFPSEAPFDKIVAAFATRRLGKGDSSSESLNAGLHTGDDPVNVLENRRLIFDALGLDRGSFTAAQQVHGDNICRVTSEQRGKGALSYDDAIAATDALITDVPGVPVGVFTADCVPIFLYDPRRVAVGIVHAGWRSTALCIARKTVERMREEFGSDPADMWAAFGPSIGPCCYEVGRDVYDAFKNRDRPHFPDKDETGATQKRGGKMGSVPIFRRISEAKWHLDLWLANRRQLEDCGVSGERIINPEICSACNSHEYFSARRLGPAAGRTLSVIAVV